MVVLAAAQLVESPLPDPPAPDGPAPIVRVRCAPPLEPPFDDEQAPCSAAADRPGVVLMPISAPTCVPRSHSPATSASRAAAGPVTPRPPRGPDRSVGGATADRMAPTPTAGADASRVAGTRWASARNATSPARAAARRFVGICVEVLNGHRPVSHLRAITAPGDVTGVTDQLVRRTVRTYLGRPGASAPGPHRVRLRSLHTCEPRDGVAELTAVLEYGMRTWAMAARLERRSDTWLCTLVQVL
jgi:hypothetical protein